MYGDFSRSSFDPARHYTRVLMQQGRPLTDADWNEQASIAAELQRELVHSLLGHDHGTFDGGFLPLIRDNVDYRVLALCRGTYYVNGLRCRLDSRDEAERSLNLSDVGTGKQWLLYLEAWESTITPATDVLLLEPTLQRINTSWRARVAWRVILRMFDDKQNSTASGAANKNSTCTQVAPSDAVSNDRNHTNTAPGPEQSPLRCDCPSLKLGISPHDKRTLRLQRISPTVQDGPCTPTEPQKGNSASAEILYRVEVHRGGRPHDVATGSYTPGSRMTFKWSRENGAGVFAVARPIGPGQTFLDIDRRRFAARDPLAEKDKLELRDQNGLSINALPLTDPGGSNSSDPSKSIYAAKLLLTVDRVDSDRIAVSPALNVIAEEPLPQPSCWLVASSAKPYRADESRLYYVQRWSHSGVQVSGSATDPANGALVTSEATAHRTTQDIDGAAIAVCGQTSGGNAAWLNLENGIQIQFVKDVSYAEGDYWLIRVSAAATGGYVVAEPRQNQNDSANASSITEIPLAGNRHYAALGILALPEQPQDGTALQMSLKRDDATGQRCWNGRKLVPDSTDECTNTAQPCDSSTDITPLKKDKPSADSPHEATPSPAPAPAPAPAEALPPPAMSASAPTPVAVLSAAGIQALGGQLQQGKDITRRVPARYLNHEPQSPAYRRFRAPLLVSEILEPTFDAYFAKVQECLQRMQVGEDESHLIRADAQADYALAQEFRSMMAAGRGLRGGVA